MTRWNSLHNVIPLEYFWSGCFILNLQYKLEGKRRDTISAKTQARDKERISEDGKQHEEKEAGEHGHRWVKTTALPVLLIVLAGIGVSLPESLSYEARIALFTFAFATILWSTTKLKAAFVALAATVFLVVSGGRPQEVLFESLATDVIWLMIGAFVLGEAVKSTNLAARLTNYVTYKAGKVSQVFWLLTGVISVLSFFIPSTSGRAAVILPVYNSLSDKTGNPKVTRALSILIPTIVLTSTICTLIGAGSHLVANDLLAQITGAKISYMNWAVYGIPFGFTASAISCFIILRMFLDKEQRALKLKKTETGTPDKLSAAEWKTVVIAVVMVALWMTESYHHYEIAFVSIVGALVLMMPGLGVLSWKDGLKSVSWNLILFVGAALVLGEALIDTGAAQWLIDHMFAITGISRNDPDYLLLTTIAVVTLTSHIYITSHTARAAALIPAMIYFATRFDFNPAAFVFIGTVGMNYCLTLPVSSKALLIYEELEAETFQPPDLLKLSAVLVVVHLILMYSFYYFYWQFIGLKF